MRFIAMDQVRQIITKSPEETIKIGNRLAKYFKAGDIICLVGDLGSGKTTLIKGIARGLNVRQSKVHSPTFVLMNVYHGRLPLFHFDLYRLEGIADISSIGYEEFLYDDGVAVVEWADRMASFIPQEHLSVHLKHKNEQTREISFTAKGERYNKILAKLNLDNR